MIRVVKPIAPGGPRQSGSVLVLALLVTLAILGIGLTAMWLSSSSMKMSSNISRRQEALYAAEAGLEHARFILKNTADWNTLMAGCGASMDDPGDPKDGHKGIVMCDGTPPKSMQERKLLDKTTTSTKVKAPWMEKLHYTVYIRNDDAEVEEDLTVGWNGDKDARVVIRAEGTGLDQLSFFAIEAVVSRAAATLDEDSYSQLGGSAQNTNSDEAAVPVPSKSP